MIYTTPLGNTTSTSLNANSDIVMPKPFVNQRVKVVLFFKAFAMKMTDIHKVRK